MTISLINTGKRFNRDWIFRHINFQFLPGNIYAIIGPNGSGKSTLLQVIAGALSPSEGKLTYQRNNNAGDKTTGATPEEVYLQIAFAAPYLELIEEMTLREFLLFHEKFKPFKTTVSIQDIIRTIGLEDAVNKQIRYFSSGMKQRVKLAQSFFSDTPVLLLDEPCTNLDKEGVSLYRQLIVDYGKGRLVIISSNDPVEYDFCDEQILISDYK